MLRESASRVERSGAKAKPTRERLRRSPEQAEHAYSRIQLDTMIDMALSNGIGSQSWCRRRRRCTFPARSRLRPPPTPRRR